MSTDPSAREEFGPYLPLVGPSYVDKQGQTKTVAFNNIPDLEAAFEAVGEETAAFLVEPVQGEAG
jgi:ornithine--oxo-acid transaminase